jgi:ferredoxin-NADP reductase
MTITALLTSYLAPFGLTTIDLISYFGLAACGTMGLGILLGMLMSIKYDPVVSWPHRKLPIFRMHNTLAYATVLLIITHPLLLLTAEGKGFGLTEILLPFLGPYQPFENTLGAIALYATLAIFVTSYFRKSLSFRRWKVIHYTNYLTAITFLFHSTLTNPNLNDKPIDFMDGGKVFVLLSVVIVTLSIIGRAFYAGRASRQGVTTTEAFYASAERWEGRLRVARKFLETGAVQTFRLMTETGAPLPFHWKAGQYVTLALQTPNGPIRRAYTIASSPNQSRFLEITVKREATGGGSQYLHDDVQVGQLLSVKGPQGDFTFMGDEADSIVMIAGGVGITPMMSTLRHLTETAWTHPVTLIYGTQSLADVIFRDELAVIEKRYPNFRLHLLPTTVEDPTWAGPQGYLSPEMILGFVPNIAHARVHLCGPAPMMAAVLKMLDGLGVNEAAIFTEAFTSLPFEPGPGADEEISMTFAKSNKTVIARRGDGVIRVAEANGIAMDYSCRNGECGSCRCKLLAGEVDMPDKTSLTAKERKTGFILACVARPVSDAITLDL